MAEWTLDTLRTHFEALLKEIDRRVEQRFADQEKAVSAALAAAEKAVLNASAAAEKAVLKAESASDKRFEAVNEFRAALNDQSKMLITRDEVEQRLKSNDDKTDLITSRMDRLEGRSDGSDKNKTDIRLWLLAAIATISILLVIIEKFGKGS
jgi:hypothetical protein